jgi:hypothetical protein
MRNFNLRYFLTVLCLCSILAAFSAAVNAAPVKFNQVVQVIDPKPGKSAAGGFLDLRMESDFGGNSDDEDKKKAPKQDGRVITETKIEIVEDDVCDCVEETVITRGFPKWTLFGLGAVPLIFLFRDKDRERETPTPTTTPTTTPTSTPTATPTPTVTPTPTTPTPTPPEPVPEPMTILLFGTGLAGIGIAARKRFGKKDKKENVS